MNQKSATPVRPVRRKPLARRGQDRLKYALEARFKTEASLIRAVDRDVSEAWRRARSAPPRASRHLLVLPKGHGNIGDQSMLEAFLTNTTLPVTLVMESEAAYDVPVEAQDRVSKVVIPDLFAARPWVRRKVRRTIASLLASHLTFSIVGADVMDGNLDAAESSIRFGMLCMSNEVGTPNRVLGFSWHGVVPPESVRHALGISQPRSMLCVRDPHSLDRIREAGGSNLVQVADTVFTLAAVEPYSPIAPWLKEQGSRPIVVVNVSGVLARRGISTSEYVDVVRHLLQRGCSVVALPHVIRVGDNDLTACVELVSELDPSSHIYLVDDLLRPCQVAWLVSHASAALTGRMHLSIISLNQGVPAAILSTQGKVSGLLEVLDLEELMLEPEAGFSPDAINALDQILDDPSTAERLSVHLPQLRELAKLNFFGLESMHSDTAAADTSI